MVMLSRAAIGYFRSSDGMLFEGHLLCGLHFAPFFAVAGASPGVRPSMQPYGCMAHLPAVAVMTSRSRAVLAAG
jgi:hypothetical protein